MPTTTPPWLAADPPERPRSNGCTSSAPARPEELATTSDAVAENPVRETDYSTIASPFNIQLSSEAQQAGWTALTQGPRVDCGFLLRPISIPE